MALVCAHCNQRRGICLSELVPASATNLNLRKHLLYRLPGIDNNNGCRLTGEKADPFAIA